MASIERRVDAFGRFFAGSRAVALLVAVNVAVFILAAVAETVVRLSGGDPSVVEGWLMLPSPFAATLFRPWTWLTYMVTQASLLHLIFNMLWLIAGGGLLREITSDRNLLLLYAIGGIAGGIFFEAANAAGSSLVGSSASVLALITAAGLRMADRRVRMILLGEVRFKWVALVMIALTFAGAGGSSATGALWAHVGGVAAGLVFAILDRREEMRGEARGERRGERRANDMYGAERGHSRTRVNAPAPARRRKFDAGAVKRVAEAMEGRLSDPARLDQLLDKIRVSGYASLSKTEQHELEEISKRIKPQK